MTAGSFTSTADIDFFIDVDAAGTELVIVSDNITTRHQVRRGAQWKKDRLELGLSGWRCAENGLLEFTYMAEQVWTPLEGAKCHCGMHLDASAAYGCTSLALLCAVQSQP